MEWPPFYSKILALEEMDYTQSEIAAFIAEQTGEEVTRDMVRHALSRARSAAKTADMEEEIARAGKNEETVEYNGSDGSYKSTKLLEMTAEQCKDPVYLLQAHGFDPDAWELVGSKNKIWNVYSKKDGVSTLYSSAISVRPLKAGFNLDEVVAAVTAVQPVLIKTPAAGAKMLELGFVDMHFGNSTLELYKPILNRTCEVIMDRDWAEIVIPIGSDLFHVDNFKNTTSNLTQQSSVNWPEAWADALAFWSTIIELALACSVKVYGIYVVGNHDESMSWAFCQMLAAKYPQVDWDLTIADRKVHTFHDVAVGITHGDNRTHRDLDRIFMAEFPEFAAATVREVHAAHVHHEVSVDQYGVVQRSLSSACRTDKWHRTQGYVGAMKRFQLFEWDKDALSSIRYV